MLNVFYLNIGYIKPLNSTIVFVYHKKKLNNDFTIDILLPYCRIFELSNKLSIIHFFFFFFITPYLSYDFLISPLALYFQCFSYHLYQKFYFYFFLPYN